MPGFEAAQFLELVGRLVDWVLNHPAQLLALLALFTFIGQPLKRTIDEVARLLTAPGRGVVDLLQPAVGPSRPWALALLAGEVASFFAPIRDRPVDGLHGAITSLAAAIQPILRGAAGLFRPVIGPSRPWTVALLAGRVASFFA